ncbi:MAG: 6-carboxytetrahydropterin synthase [Chloroherpetonaceae bacterium]|nr:6-carboxytetrahydropterin synthase [Chloroherpetonaceae bacterium]
MSNETAEYKNPALWSVSSEPREINAMLRQPRKVYVTRKVHFNAAHRLFNPTFSDEKNCEIYDICNNFYGHGHNYELEVTLTGIVDKDTGYLFDLKVLKKILEEEIISKVDHKHLNFDVEMFRDTVPTAEVIAVVFWEKIKAALEALNVKNVELYEVKVYESERNIVSYRGE